MEGLTLCPHMKTTLPAEQWALARIKSATKLWTEDDARPVDAETTSEAWLRLFGESKPDADERIANINLEDCFYYEYPKGRVHFLCCDGSEILQLPEEAYALTPIEPSPEVETQLSPVEKDLARTKQVLGTLITWLVLDLGEANVKTLLDDLQKP